MSSLHTQFSFAFYGTIKTREQVEAFLHFRIEPTAFDRLAYAAGFKTTERLYNEIGPELHAKAQAATCRWALQFSSADAALDPSAYTSLEVQLLAIASTLFTIVSANVTNVVPITLRLDPPKSNVEPPPPPPPPSIEDQVRDEVMPAVRMVKAYRNVESEITEQDPELAKDPFLGFKSGTVTTPSGQIVHVQGLLKRKFDHLKGEALK